MYFHNILNLTSHGQWSLTARLLGVHGLIEPFNTGPVQPPSFVHLSPTNQETGCPQSHINASPMSQISDVTGSLESQISQAFSQPLLIRDTAQEC